MFGLALIYGFLAAAAALFVQVIFLYFTGATTLDSPSLLILLVAAMLEEGARLIFLLQLAKHHPNATSYIHALFFGIGFVIAELSLLALSPTDFPETILALQMVLVHLVGTAIIYCGIRFRNTFPFAPLAALAMAILFHTLYNVSI